MHKRLTIPPQFVFFSFDDIFSLVVAALNQLHHLSSANANIVITVWHGAEQWKGARDHLLRMISATFHLGPGAVCWCSYETVDWIVHLTAASLQNCHLCTIWNPKSLYCCLYTLLILSFLRFFYGLCFKSFFWFSEKPDSSSSLVVFFFLTCVAYMQYLARGKKKNPHMNIPHSFHSILRVHPTPAGI